MNDKEKLIKEQRLAEAIANDFLGLDGKFGIILKYLGKPVISQSSSSYDRTEWVDVYDIPEEGLPTADVEGEIRELGKLFEGLKFGIHLEIKYLKEGTIPEKVTDWYTKYHPAEKVISVLYKGYLVYLEADGDLITYVPMQDWEQLVGTLYKKAQQIKNRYKHVREEEMKEENKQNKLSWLQQMRELWGI